MPYNTLELFLANSASSGIFTSAQRLAWYRCHGLRIEKGGTIAPRCYFTHSNLETVSIGSNTTINHDVLFDNGAAIEIGSGCDIAMHCKFITATHAISPLEDKRAGYGCIRRAIAIGNGCWLGCGVVVLPGVTIGSGCVIGAGSLVIQDCKPNGLYVGIPAKRVKELETTAKHC